MNSLDVVMIGYNMFSPSFEKVFSTVAAMFCCLTYSKSAEHGFQIRSEHIFLEQYTLLNKLISCIILTNKGEFLTLQEDEYATRL
jgi:hypothetical protein